MAEFRAVNISIHVTHLPSLVTSEAYTFDIFKVNFDAFWDQDNNEVDVSVVVRDHMGVFFKGLSKASGEASSAEIAELLVAGEAIVFVWEFGFQDVILESDNITIMNVIRSNEISLSSGGALVANVFQISLSCNRCGILAHQIGV